MAVIQKYGVMKIGNKNFIILTLNTTTKFEIAFFVYFL